MGVVDDDQDRLLLGGHAEQRQHREAQQEPIDREGVHQPEGGAERPALRIGELHIARQDRTEQAVERRIGQLLLRLAPAHPEDRAIPRPRADRVQQRRLPDPRLTLDHEHPAATVTRIIERVDQPSVFLVRPSSVVTTAR